MSPKLYDSATDCICSALFICDELSVFGSLASVLQTHVMDLVPLFNASIETEDVDRYVVMNPLLMLIQFVGHIH